MITILRARAAKAIAKLPREDDHAKVDAPRPFQFVDCLSGRGEPVRIVKTKVGANSRERVDHPDIKYRQLGPSQAQTDVERNTLMNILNRASKTTKEIFSEDSLVKNHSFRPWPKDRPLDAEGLSRCPHCD